MVKKTRKNKLKKRNTRNVKRRNKRKKTRRMQRGGNDLSPHSILKAKVLRERNCHPSGIMAAKSYLGSDIIYYINYPNYVNCRLVDTKKKTTPPPCPCKITIKRPIFSRSTTYELDYPKQEQSILGKAETYIGKKIKGDPKSNGKAPPPGNAPPSDNATPPGNATPSDNATPPGNAPANNTRK